MKATVIHRSFKEMGGAERVALATMAALQEMDFKVTLVTIHKPDFNDIKKRYGIDLEINKVRFVLPSYIDLSGWPIHFQALPPILTLASCSTLRADIIINTHAEIPLPYCTLTLPYSTPNGAPLISYIQDLPTHQLCSMRKYPSRYGSSALWKLYFTSYRLVLGSAFDALERYAIGKGLIITNSEFTKRAMKSLYPEIEPVVIPPPVDVKKFTPVLNSDVRKGRVLIIARIHPEKRLENAIELARLLPEHIKFTVAGTYSASEHITHYYERLNGIIRRYGLEGRFEIRTNVSHSKLLELMAESDIYFHPKPSEAFGIAIVEAMAAGLMPVVPDCGGQTEFVPRRFQYHTIADAVAIVEKCIGASKSERCSISGVAGRFSEEEFKSRMKQAISSAIG